MEAQNYLGIYLSKASATVVCLSSAKSPQLLCCFSISVEREGESDDNNFAVLAELILQGCQERELKFGEIAIALDCSMFMQHSVHSEFTDARQIGQTIRFDTEEALASDVTDFAIVFRIDSTDESGCDLTVFTARKQILKDILDALGTNKLDPAVVEPDVNCLRRFISRQLSTNQRNEGQTVFAAFSKTRGYFISPTDAENQSVKMRTFLPSGNQSNTEMLARQIPLITGLFGSEQSVTTLKILDSKSNLDCQQLQNQFGIEVKQIDLVRSAGLEEESLADCADTVEFSLAFGAALAQSKKTQSTNFRSDFMPYQGGKMRLERLLKRVSIAAVVIVLILGGYFQLALMKKNKPIRQLRKKFNGQYSAVMYGKKPKSKLDPVKKLAGELRRIENLKSGQLSITGKKSVSAKLTMVFEAFNKCSKQANLRIDSISITSKAISIVGNTNSRKNTLKLRSSIESSNLKILQDNLELKAGRDNFRITIAPKE